MTKELAAIWDLDGVIVDSAAVHFASWQSVFRDKGVELELDEFKRLFGQRNDRIIRTVLGQDVPQAEVQTIARNKDVRYRELVKDKIRPLPGAIELIKGLADAGFRMGLASSGQIENILLVVNSLGIANYFRAIVSGHDVSESKPSPQIYLLTAKRLEVKPERCVVFEDAIAGVAGAKKAGMRCIAVTTTNPRSSLMQADLIVDSLAEVTVADIGQLLDSGKD